MSDITNRKVQVILDRHKKMEQEKQPWLKNYQKIGELVMTRKQSFTSNVQQGEFVTSKIFSGEAGRANHIMASTMLGALWPNGAKSIQIVPPDDLDPTAAESQDVKDFYAEVTKRVVAAIDNPLAGFATSLDEYMLDQGAFGISGVAVFETEDSEMPVRFEAVDAKKITIAENKYGVVDTVYICKEMTIRQLYQEYKEEISATSLAAFKNGKLEEKVKVLHAIEPRIDHIIGGYGNANYPIASIEIEMGQNKILRETGFHEMPVFVTRFWKAMGEIYGRSPAMELMPEIAELNIQTELIIRAGEKQLNPPLLVAQECVVGNGTLNTSAGAINVRRMSGRAEGASKAVETIVTIGELQSTYKRIDTLTEIVKDGFFQDRLAGLDNEQRMTLGEANIRNDIRGQTLGNIYSRQIIELFSPLITRVFNILLGRDMFGVPAKSQIAVAAQAMGIVIPTIPDAVIELMKHGKEAYKVVFISPAARIMRREELKGISEMLGAAERVGPLAPDFLDNYDMDNIARNLQDLHGAPANCIRSMEKVKEIRDARAQAQQQQNQIAMAQAQAEIAKTTSQAAQHATKAGLDPNMLAQGAA